MRTKLIVAFLAVASAMAQYIPPSGGGGGGGAPSGPAGGALTGTYPNPGVGGFTKGVGTLTGPATGGTVSPTPGANGIPQLDPSQNLTLPGNLAIGATVLKPGGPGVINVRLQYGAVPDGSTDNSTAIANAFANSNAFTSGIPTIYFDCSTNGQTVCQYNYGGSGISPINPLRATTIMCAPGATLNYTGTAHAADFGPTTLTKADEEIYTVQGCRWTGGASYTAGLYWNNFVANPHIISNHFYNFGNQTGYTIVFPGNNWMPLVSLNRWTDTDGFSKNMVDAHAGINVGMDFSLNKSECLTSNGLACSVSTVGVGLWLFTGRVTNNEIKFHAPLIRISSCTTCGGGQGLFIAHNLLEGNTNQPGPAITFGDPGTVGAHMVSETIEDNFTYWPTVSAVPTIGPETASSGSFNLDGLTLTGNIFAYTPTGGAAFVNTNQGVRGYVANNRLSSGVPLTKASSPPVIDSGFATQNTYFAVQSISSTSLAGAVPVFDSDGINLGAAAASNIVSLFSTCSGTKYLGADAACHTPGTTTTIATGTATLGTSAIANNACASVVTVAATGTVTTDAISWTPNGDLSAVTGYGAASTDGLKIYPYPTSGNVNFKVCNGTGTSITPGSATLNWLVVR